MATLTMNARLRQTEGVPEEQTMNSSKSSTAHLSAWDFHVMTLNGELDRQWDDLPEPFEPPVDDLPEAWEIVANNDGPTMVNICHDVSGNGDIECWDVPATVNSPQWSEVA